MKINTVMMKNINNIDNNKISFIEGSIISGKIVDSDDGVITIDLGNNNILKGKTLIPIDNRKGQNIKLLVKNIDGSKVFMTPINGEKIKNNDAKSMVMNILKKNNIDAKPQNISIVENLIKFDMPVNEQNVSEISKVFEKFEGFNNLEEGEILQTIDNKDLLSQDVRKIFKTKVLDKTVETRSTENTDEFVQTIDQLLKDDIGQEKLIKKMTFLMKSNIKPSVNNLSNISDWIEGKNHIEYDVKRLLEDLGKQDTSVKTIVNKFKNLLENNTINLDFSDKELIKDYYSKLSELVKEVKKQLLTKSKTFKNELKKIQLIEQKMEFINKININNTFVYYPTAFDRDNIREKIYFLKNKKNKDKSNNIVIFMSLETVNMNKVEVLCNILKDNINIDFKIKNQELINLFRTEENKLIKTLEKCGFSNAKIKYDLTKDEVDILEIFTSNNIQNFSLDIRT